MKLKRSIVNILILTIAFTVSVFFCTGACEGQQSAVEGKGPATGKWAFEGKDDKGVVRTGTLTIKELDKARFDANRFHSMCVLESESKESSYGVDTPCTWDQGKKEVSFGTERSAYSAILSADGKNMTLGKWTDSEKDFSTRKVTVKKTGVWSAKYLGQ